MDRKTLHHLSSRLDLLEIVIGDVNSTTGKNLQTQISELQSKTGHVYGQSSEFQSLFTMLKELGLLAKEDNKVAEDVENCDSDLSSESKRMKVLLNYSIVKEAYNNLIQLSTMDVPKLINYISQSQDKTHDFNQDSVKILQRRYDLEWISQTFHNLVMKNVIVFDKYIRLMAEENEFWLETEQKLKVLQTSIKKMEKKQLEMSKY